jgi:hypothetical protein
LRRNQKKNPQKIKVPFQKRCKRSSGGLNEEMEMNGDGAKRLGEKLLMDVEVEDLGSVCDINTRLVCKTNNTNINSGVEVSSQVGDSGRRIVRLFLTILKSTNLHTGYCYLRLSTDPKQSQRHKQYEMLLFQHPRNRPSCLEFRHPNSRTRLSTTNPPCLGSRKNFTSLPHHCPRHPPSQFLHHPYRRSRSSRRPLRPTTSLQHPPTSRNNALPHEIPSPGHRKRYRRHSTSRHEVRNQNSTTTPAHIPPPVLVLFTINSRLPTGVPSRSSPST